MVCLKFYVMHLAALLSTFSRLSDNDCWWGSQAAYSMTGSDEAFVAVDVNSSRAASDAHVGYLKASMLFTVKFPLWKTAFVVVVTLILVVFRLFNC